MPSFPLARKHPTTGLTMGYYRICGRPALGDRPALPAGHPDSWGLLTRGTVLDGADYPFPVFNT